jgi:hypothetical protein
MFNPKKNLDEFAVVVPKPPWLRASLFLVAVPTGYSLQRHLSRGRE